MATYYCAICKFFDDERYKNLSSRLGIIFSFIIRIKLHQIFTTEKILVPKDIGKTAVGIWKENRELILSVCHSCHSCHPVNLNNGSGLSIYLIFHIKYPLVHARIFDALSA